jgi:predicted nuclease of predicted toxin-antitoxin system
MRVLLDECLPKRLKRDLVGHEVQTVPEAGWAGRKNGELLGLAAGRFDAFITIDRNLVYQQRVVGLSFGVLVLRARSNRLSDLQVLVPKLLEALAVIRPGEVIQVGG